MCLVGH